MGSLSPREKSMSRRQAVGLGAIGVQQLFPQVALVLAIALAAPHLAPGPSLRCRIYPTAPNLDARGSAVSGCA